MVANTKDPALSNILSSQISVMILYRFIAFLFRLLYVYRAGRI